MSLKNKVSHVIDGLLLAFQFMTTIPINKQVPYDEVRGRMSVLFYPVTGLVLGVALALQVMLLSPLPVTVAAFWLLLFSVLYTGGLHLDGWMDVSDSILSYRDKERKLAIMKDSHVGAFAVLSVIFLLAGRFIFIFETMKLAGTETFFYALVIPFFVRIQIAFNLYFGTPANKEGMAAMVKPLVTKRTLWSNVVMVVVGTVLVYTIVSDFLTVWFICLAVLTAFSSCSFVLFKKQFGGMTGDTIGTQMEGGETLLWMTVWLLLYLGMA